MYFAEMWYRVVATAVVITIIVAIVTNKRLISLAVTKHPKGDNNNNINNIAKQWVSLNDSTTTCC